MIAVKSPNPKRSVKKRFKIITKASIVILILLAILFVFRGQLKSLVESSQNQNKTTEESQNQTENKTITLNKKFYFPQLVQFVHFFNFIHRAHRVYLTSFEYIVIILIVCYQTVINLTFRWRPEGRER